MSKRNVTFKERSKLTWKTFAPTQDRGYFEDWGGVMPPPKYATKYIIHPEDFIPHRTVEGKVAEGSEFQPGEKEKEGWTTQHCVVTANCGTLTVSCGMITVPPGHGSAEKGGTHMHTCEMIWYVLEGEGWMEIEDERHNFKAGDWIFVPIRHRHRHVNTGNKPLKAIFIRGVMLRSYDGSCVTPIDYREYDVIEQKEEK